MKQWTIIMAALLFFVMAPLTIVEAHTSLESSNPEADSTVEEPVESIELTFNTEIEEASTLTITDGNGEVMEPASVDIADNMMTANLNDPLPAGDYTVNWNIVGADGHIIEKEFTFTTTYEEPETVEEEAVETPSDEGQEESPDQEDSTVESEQDTADEDSGFPVFFYVLLGIIIALVLVLIGRLAFSKK
ncbi:UNVERIFIED_CONTAM: copper resistance protein CopC [Halobacillus marinus]